MTFRFDVEVGMAGKSDRRQNIGITEFATGFQGALSPFGEELALPMPVEAIHYEHPLPDELPAPAVDTDGERRGDGHR